eukprot:TRINITY_DN2382_c0_g1_i1.p1 TRINITY_DN2382_c0_g1~~TRINITY_DN2382_c0_g1_i1.p1  ORF type:complete len:1853 (+),score=104.69 TRINITY_DN2382_c0_g1_i1:61-5559(+)
MQPSSISEHVRMQIIILEYASNHILWVFTPYNQQNTREDSQLNTSFKMNPGDSLSKISPLEIEKSMEMASSRHMLGGFDDESIIKENLADYRIRRAPTPVITIPIQKDNDGALTKIGQIESKTPIELLQSGTKSVFYALKCVIVYVRYYVSSACLYIVQRPWFETLVLLTIVANCVPLAISDPTSSTEQPWIKTFDDVFTALFTAELALKVFALGFLFNEGAYLRDPWNVLDFFVVAFGYLDELNVQNGGIDLKPLRIFRVLRPLRTITNIKGLRVLMAVLVSSLPLLLDVLIIFAFFLIIFSIAGLQLWHGVLTKRCMELSTGTVDIKQVCGYLDCPKGYICVNYIENPNYGVTNFDNFFSSLLVVFLTATLEGWTGTQMTVIHAYGYTATIFFSLVTLIGAYFLSNFALGVTKSRIYRLYEVHRNRKKVTTTKATKPSSVKRALTLPTNVDIINKILNKRKIASLEENKKVTEDTPGIRIKNLEQITRGLRMETVDRDFGFGLDTPLSRLRRTHTTAWKDSNDLSGGVQTPRDFSGSNADYSFADPSLLIDDKGADKIVSLVTFNGKDYDSFVDESSDSIEKEEEKMSEMLRRRIEIYERSAFQGREIGVQSAILPDYSALTIDVKNVEDGEKSKIVLTKESKIDLTSKNDVLSKCMKCNHAPIIPLLETPPYKVKVAYVPAEPRKLAPQQPLPLVKTEKTVEWSGQDVLKKPNPYSTIWFTKELTSLKLWRKGWKGIWAKLKHRIKVIMISKITFGIMTLCALVNTVILATIRYGQPEDEAVFMQQMNNVFTYIFIAEMMLKVFGLGVVRYLSDPINCADGLVVILSIVELVFLGSSHVTSSFRSLQAFRTLRAFRLIRMVRCLRASNSMKLLVQIVASIMVSFVYIGVLLIIFTFIYSLLGMRLFGGRFDFPDGKPRQNYDSFYKAFLSVYQVLTHEGWQSLLYSSMRAQIPIVAVFFYVTWMLIGNYALLNLFLAMMLDAFKKVEDEYKKVGNDKKEESREEIAKVKSSPEVETTATGTANRRIVKPRVSFDNFNDAALYNSAKEIKTKVSPEDTKCNFSLYLFSRENRFRVLCWRLVAKSTFELVILLLICMTSVLLAVDTFYMNNPDPVMEKVLEGLNSFFIFCFICEAVIKIVAYGFMFEPGSYLRDIWNIIDFIIVVTSIVDICSPDIDLPMIRIIRLFRTFRPLRFLSHNVHMKVTVNTLFRSLGALCNTLILILFIFTLFSIVGVSFFAGKFQYCTINVYEQSTKSDCLNAGGEWRTYDHNFDNVINGLIYLFELTTRENWPTTVYQAIDCTDIEKGPKKEASWYYSFYYVIFLFVGSTFLLNLFLGVLFYNYTKIQQHETSNKTAANKQQLDWIEIQDFIVKAVPNYNIRYAPGENSWKWKVYMFTAAPAFEAAMAVVIILNVFQLALVYEGQSAEYGQMLDRFNYMFTGIFTVELVLKHIAFGFNFWKEPWNVLGFIIVASSYIDIVIKYTSDTTLTILTIGPQLFRILRVLRMTRLLRLARKFTEMQEIMEIIQLCFASILNVFALLALILFIYAIIGCYLFNDVTTGDSINSVYNFTNFAFSLMACLKIATGEDWNLLMFDCARTSTSCVAGVGCGKWYAYVYFISFKIVITFIMLNLFVLVVLQLFEKYFDSSDNILRKFKNDFEIFQEVWRHAKPTKSGLFISTDKLRKFFTDLPPYFGFNSNDVNLRTKQIMSLGIRSDPDSNVYFNELLYCTLQRLYAEDLERDAFMQEKEVEIRKKIFRAARKAAQNSKRQMILKQVNPFVSLMILRMTFKLWKGYANNCMGGGGRSKYGKSKFAPVERGRRNSVNGQPCYS